MKDCLSLDGNLVTPVLDLMLWLASRRIVEEADLMFPLLNCDPREIIWTSGALNLII